MKKQALGIFAATIMILSLTPSLAWAVDGQTETENPKPTTTSVVEDKTKTELETRIEKRTTDLKTKLTTAQKTILKSRCKAAQGKMSSVSERAKGVEVSRSKVYANVVERLTKLSEKLKEKDVDTTELDASIVALQAKITTFNTDLATYKQAVADLQAMDCIANPDGFKASLEAARAALDTVKKDAAGIRAHITDGIKPILKTIRASLEKTEDN